MGNDKNKPSHLFRRVSQKARVALQRLGRELEARRRVLLREIGLKCIFVGLLVVGMSLDGVGDSESGHELIRAKAPTRSLQASRAQVLDVP